MEDRVKQFMHRNQNIYHALTYAVLKKSPMTKKESESERYLLGVPAHTNSFPLLNNFYLLPRK